MIWACYKDIMKRIALHNGELHFCLTQNRIHVLLVLQSEGYIIDFCIPVAPGVLLLLLVPHCVNHPPSTHYWCYMYMIKRISLCIVYRWNIFYVILLVSSRNHKAMHLCAVVHCKKWPGYVAPNLWNCLTVDHTRATCDSFDGTHREMTRTEANRSLGREAIRCIAVLL